MPRSQLLTTAHSRRHAKALKGAPVTPAAVLADLPAKLDPQLATNATESPPGDNWVSEIKLDGYRLLVWSEQGRVRPRHTAVKRR